MIMKEIKPIENINESLEVSRGETSKRSLPFT